MNHKAFANKMNAYTILYVEDDIAVQEYIAEFLRRYCKTVYAVSIMSPRKQTT